MYFQISSEPAFSSIEASAIAVNKLTNYVYTNTIMRKTILFFTLLIFYFSAFSQDQTNKGKDFWVPYPEHIDGTNSAMGLYITSDVASTGVITVGAVTIPFTVIPNTVVYKFLGPNAGGDAPNTGVYLGGYQDNVVSGRGIHVTSSSPVVVFAHIIRSARSGATLVLPTKVWGKEYIMPSFANSGTSQSFPELCIYASKPNTVVEITPTVASRNGAHPAGTPFQVTIPNVGDVYQLQFALNSDPSGTLVKSLASATGCNPIAVFSATTWSGINCNNASGGDNFYQQLFPSSSWGKQFVTGPLKKVATNAADNNVDIVRVFVKDPTTVVTKTDNGVTTTLTGLTANNYYQYTASRPTLLQADKPIQVIQYVTSQNCGSPQTNSDPEMIALSAIEQTINDITVFSAHTTYVPPGQSQVTTHYINVIMKTVNTSLFRINGVAPNAVFTAIPRTIYSYLKEDVTTRAASNPVFRLTADSGFTAIAYGFGNVESYGYNAGTNVKDLYQQIGVSTEFGIEQTPSVCTNTPFRFKISLPYQPDSIFWNISSLPASTVPNNTSVMTRYPPSTFDSVTIVNGKNIWWYSLPSLYSISAIGTYPITLTTYFPNGECGNSQDIDFELQVSNPPVPGFTEVIPGCYAEPVQFIETTPQTPKATYKWYWDFGDGNTSTGKNPSHTYAAPGTYNVRYASITTPGCLSDTINHTVTIPDLPKATASGTTTVCFNATAPAIIFTGTDGAAPYEFSYTINGIAQTPVISNAAGIYTFSVPTNIAGPFVYAITNVKNVGSTLCTRPVINQSATVTVNPLPQAVIAGAVTVCLNAAAPPVTLTGSGGTAPYTFAYTINGVPQTPVLSNGAGVYVINAPTGVAGTFTYSVTSVTDASSTLCSRSYNNTVTTSITVLPLPTVNFVTNTPLCETRDISFTDNSNPQAGTLATWAWNFGDPNATPGNPNTSVIQNPLHNYSVAGTYTVSLSVTTNNGCTNAVPFTKTITINDRPKAGFIVPEVCINDVAAVFIDTSKIANGAISAAGYTWNYGDPPSGVNNTSTGMNGSHLYTLVGPYNVTHVVTSTLGCKDTVMNPIFINGANPVADFSVTNPTALCANDSVSITNLSTISQGSITKVEIYWDWIGAPATVQVDDFPAPNKVYRHKYPNFQAPLTKPYTIRFVAYSGTLCLNTKNTIITVNAAPKVQFNNMPDACYDAAPFLITQGSEVGGVPGTFAYSGPGIINSNGLFNPVVAGVGTHTIKYTYTSAAGGCVDTASKTITVLDTSSAKFSFLTPTCQGSATTFKEESTAPAGVTLTNTVWNFGDGSPLENHAPGSTFTHTYTAWGNYTVTMYNASAYGCKSKTKQQVVYVSPIPNTAFAFGQTSVCIPNADVSFINNSTIADGTENAFTYLWDLGDLTSSLAKTPAPHHYTTVGPYTVTLTVTSGTGCSKTVSHDVNFIHPQPKTAFNFNKPSVCIGDNVLMTDFTNGLDGTITQWVWKFTDGGSASTQQVLYTFSAPKTYDVSLYTINSNGCNSDTLTKQFTVYAYPQVDAGPDRVVLEGGTITIEPIVTGNGLQYLWTPNTYLDNDHIEKPTAKNMLNDITYTLTVTGEGGCTAPPDKMFVKVLKMPKVPNTFTPNGDGINETWKIEYLDTYPNCKVQVFTRTGQLVFESRGYKTPWDGRYNGKPLPFDTYYYIIEPENGRQPVTGYVTIVK